MIHPPRRCTLFPYTTLFRSQTEINEAIGLDFAKAARHLLRQEPQGLIVGEIRDDATAQLAVRAGLTGHRSEEQTSELQSPDQLVCRLLLENKKKIENFQNAF